MNSIRRRLFAILLAATGLVWLSGVIWIQYSTEKQVGQVLDRRLEESARMVASLMGRSGSDPMTHLSADLVNDPTAQEGGHDYARQLICQVWGFDGQLRSASKGAPMNELAGRTSGFSERQVNGEAWRIYTFVDETMGLRVMVGDSLKVRNMLANDVAFGLLAPAVLILPLLALLIWWAVARGLRPLEEVAANLTSRPASDFGPLDEATVPTELRVMTTALNGLFLRVDHLRERERNFTAFAAHELKTPLAGLKAQAQIAAIAPDEATRKNALRQITEAVNRSDRLVGQLLTLSAAETPIEAELPKQDCSRLLADVVAAMRPFALSRGVALETTGLGAAGLTAHVTLLTAALRNLLENAILASPAGATVEVIIRREGREMVFEVLDRGAGIADADRPYVTDRFYRGTASPSGGGSGLGLSIVAAAMTRMRGQLILSARPGGGEAVQLRFDPDSADLVSASRAIS